MAPRKSLPVLQKAAPRPARKSSAPVSARSSAPRASVVSDRSLLSASDKLDGMRKRKDELEAARKEKKGRSIPARPEPAADSEPDEVEDAEEEVDEDAEEEVLQAVKRTRAPNKKPVEKKVTVSAPVKEQSGSTEDVMRYLAGRTDHGLSSAQVIEATQALRERGRIYDSFLSSVRGALDSVEGIDKVLVALRGENDPGTRKLLGDNLRILIAARETYTTKLLGQDEFWSRILELKQEYLDMSDEVN